MSPVTLFGFVIERLLGAVGVRQSATMLLGVALRALLSKPLPETFLLRAILSMFLSSTFRRLLLPPKNGLYQRRSARPKRWRLLVVFAFLFVLLTAGGGI